MGKRVRITNSSVNCYGTRVLTEGLDISQYERNPVLLYMHERGEVIGYMKDLKLEGDELTGEPVFDEASELSQRCKKQWEFGSLRMVSMGIDIIETSESPEHLAPGQTRPTIVKSKLDEVSIVDIGANDDAIVLKKNGRRVYDKNINEVLRLMSNNQPNQKTMSEKTEKVENNGAQSAESLGTQSVQLQKEKSGAPTGNLEQLQKENEELKAQVETLKKEIDELKLAGITASVDKAIAEKRLDAEKKSQFVELGKKVGIEELEGILGAMTPKAKLSAVLNGGRALSQGSQSNSEWKTLHDVPAEKMMELRTDRPEEYQRLYKATYQL